MNSRPPARVIPGTGKDYSVQADKEISDAVCREIIAKLEEEGQLPRRSAREDCMTIELCPGLMEVEHEGHAYMVLCIDEALGITRTR